MIDHYRVVRRLAMGGMAEIFLCVDERTGKQVALKKILPQIAQETTFMDRFFHEIRIQISLKHKNIVELLDCSPASNNAYIVMEYVDGGALSQLREAAGRFPWELALLSIADALKGLGVAHKKGIVHRDIKPQNIMWTKDGTVKIADFGISQAENLTRLTITGTVVGTPSFMSPEQARGETLDARSDLFSVVTCLYELLTGKNPFTSDSVSATLRRVVDVNPEAPSLLDPAIPPAVDVIVRKLHAKEREKRYAAAEEAAEALREVLVSEGVLNPSAIFRSFTENPAGFVAQRNKQLAAESSEKAQKLLDGKAPPEEALGAAYQTLAVTPNDPAAQSLYRVAAERAGQREKPVDNARIKELEEKLRNDPENVAVLLQLAKLYRLEKDFVAVMRFFRKLRVVAPADTYTQAQISALVGGSVPVSNPTMAVSSRRTAIVPAMQKEEPESPWPRRAALGAAALFAILVVGGWAGRPKVDISEAGEGEKTRAEALLKLLQGAQKTVGPGGVPPANARGDDGALQKALEKGALAEKEGGPVKALAFYRDAIGRMPRADHKAILLFAIADVATKSGNRAEAMRSLDEIVQLGDLGKSRALLMKGELLEKEKDDAGARQIYDDLMRSESGPARLTATLRLAMLAERGGDAQRALILYEEILAREPGAPESNAARLGAAALYRAAARTADARRMYDEVKRNAPPGSDYEKSAESGLKSLE